MPTLTAWCYQTPLGAKVGEVRMRRLQDVGALEVRCAIVVTWVHGAHRPRTGHVRHWGRDGRDDPTPLTALARTILAVAGSDAPGAAAHTAADRLSGTGIDAGFLVDVGRHFAPGRSVLLVHSGRADLEVVGPLVRQGLAGGGVDLVRAEVTAEALERAGRLLDAHDDPS